MSVVIRNMIADYLDVSKSPGASEYVLMGDGFNTLDENPQAQVETKAYIHNKSATNTIKSYQPQFPFDTDLMDNEEGDFTAAIQELYDIGRNQAQGSKAERNYVRVELFMQPQATTKYPARKFRVAVQVDGVAGGGAEVVHVTGNLNAVGDFVDGVFDTSTNTFTPASEVPAP